MKETTKVETEHIKEFAKILQAAKPFPQSAAEQPSSEEESSERTRFNVDEEGLKNGLAQLVLALVKLLHELLERQAIRRMDAGSLTEEEIERIGVALMKQSEEIDQLRELFHLEEEDLNLDLGPLGKLL